MLRREVRSSWSARRFAMASDKELPENPAVVDTILSCAPALSRSTLRILCQPVLGNVSRAAMAAPKIKSLVVSASVERRKSPRTGLRGGPGAAPAGPRRLGRDRAQPHDPTALCWRVRNNRRALLASLPTGSAGPPRIRRGELVFAVRRVCSTCATLSLRAWQLPCLVCRKAPMAKPEAPRRQVQDPTP